MITGRVTRRPPRYVKWSDAEIARLTALGYRGAEKDELMAAFPGRTWPAVQNRLQEIRAELPDMPLINRPCTIPERQRIIAMYYRGIRMRLIANAVNRDLTVIKVMITRFRRQGLIVGYRQPRPGQAKIGVAA
jgi:vacuolar-type H+-ATPase catalytic subunit A/Vma1